MDIFFEKEKVREGKFIKEQNKNVSKVKQKRKEIQL